MAHNYCHYSPASLLVLLATATAPPALSPGYLLLPLQPHACACSLTQEPAAPVASCLRGGGEGGGREGG